MDEDLDIELPDAIGDDFKSPDPQQEETVLSSGKEKPKPSNLLMSLMNKLDDRPKLDRTYHDGHYPFFKL